MKTLYLDMDGVMADFNRGVAPILGYEKADVGAYRRGDWDKIVAVEHVYRTLPLMPRAQELALVAPRFRDLLGWRLLFLTAIPKNNDVPWCFHDKMEWAREHFPDIPLHFGPYAVDKQRHCQPGDLLVDDRRSNCDEWTAAGGRAIYVEPNRYIQAIVDLEFYLDEELIAQNLPVIAQEDRITER